MHPTINIAIRVARTAGNLLTKYYESPIKIEELDRKSSSSFISDIEKHVEQLITDSLRKSFPTHAIFSKNNGALIQDRNEIQWIINPLDGGMNFIRKLPHFSVSLSMRVKEKTEFAIVFDPIRNEMFSAARGHGAQLNNYRLRVGKFKNPNFGLLATNLSIKNSRTYKSYSSRVAKVLSKFSDYRNMGASDLDLAYISSGRLDAKVEIGVSRWDVEAGLLLVREAGGMATDFSGNPIKSSENELIAGNPHIVQGILGCMSDRCQL